MIRLLNVDTFKFAQFHSERDRPDYAIASHRWTGGQEAEAALQDITQKQNRSKSGYQKVEGFVSYVKQHMRPLKWLWIDTCCIDQQSSQEVTEAINSMFRWYADATLCIAYLQDVAEVDDMAAFERSEWFSRGWTLQELLAPRTVLFLTRKWQVIGHKGYHDISNLETDASSRIGTSLDNYIAKRTGIPESIIHDYKKSHGTSSDELLSWMQGRETTRGEDRSYCLFGLLDVPIGANYGEGAEKARRRLLQAVEGEQPDLSKLVRVETATYNSTIESQSSDCLEGTRTEILSNIHQWAGGPSSKLIYWLCGKAGTGKSTIARTFAKSLDDQGRLGASFFFKRSEKSRSTADHFFPTIAAQLSDHIPPMRKPVASALNQDSFLCNRGIRLQFEKLLLGPLLGLSRSGLPQHKVAIVIDALDECDRSTDIQLFLGLLGQLKAQSGVQLCIFLTSRPELPEQLGFRQLDGSLHDDVVLEEVQEDTIAADIESYYEHQFRGIRAHRRQLGATTALPDIWPSASDRRALVNLAVPLFIFAATVCRFLSEASPERRIEMILERRYPSKLEQVYLPILHQILVDKDDDEQEEVLQDFRIMVGAALLVVDPLSIASLSTLLRVDKADLGDMFGHLQSVLHVPDDPYAPVRALHLSFRDFLVDKQRREKANFWIDEQETHRRLSLACIRRLMEPGGLKMDICNQCRPGVKRHELTAEQIKASIPDDIAYACTHWVEHLRRGPGDLHEVHQFLKRHFLHWLEAMSWLGKLSEVILRLGELKAAAKLSSNVMERNTTEFVNFLADAERFAITFQCAVDLAPLQVYHSALMFAPTNSLVRAIFIDTVPCLWQLLPPRPGSWGSREVRRFEEADSSTEIKSVVFLPDADGEILASVTTSNILQLRRTFTGEVLQELRGPEGVMFLSASLVVAWRCDEQGVRLWNVKTCEETCHYKELGKDYGFKSGLLSPDGQTVAVECRGNLVMLLDAQGGTQGEKALKLRHEKIKGVAFSPNGGLVATTAGHCGRIIELWNSRTGEQVLQLRAPAPGPFAFSPDGVTLARHSREMDRSRSRLLLCDALSGETKQAIATHESFCSTLAFAPDGQTVASAGEDYIIRLWNTHTGKRTKEFAGHEGWVEVITFSLDGMTVASAALDSTIRVWTLEPDKSADPLLEGNNLEVDTTEDHDWDVLGVAFSPDKLTIASASGDKTIRLWNAETGKQTQALGEHNGIIRAMAFSPNGKFLASTDEFVRIWDVRSGDLVRRLEGPRGSESTRVSFSPDGGVVASLFYRDGQSKDPASADRGSELLLWRVHTGEMIHAIYEDADEVTGVTFSPNGELIATPCRLGRLIRLWNIRLKEQTRMFLGHEAEVLTVAFSPCGQFLASGSEDGTVHLWNIQTGTLIRKLGGHTGDVVAVTLSFDGRIVASASLDGTIRLWDMQTDSTRICTAYAATIHRMFIWDSPLRSGGIGDLLRSLMASLNSVELVFGEDSVDLCFAPLELDDQWIKWRDEDLLWLPYGYRGNCSAIGRPDTLAIGHRSGKVLLFKLAQPYPEYAATAETSSCERVDEQGQQPTITQGPDGGALPLSLAKTTLAKG